MSFDFTVNDDQIKDLQVFLNEEADRFKNVCKYLAGVEVGFSLFIHVPAGEIFDRSLAVSNLSIEALASVLDDFLKHHIEHLKKMDNSKVCNSLPI